MKAWFMTVSLVLCLAGLGSCTPASPASHPYRQSHGSFGLKRVIHRDYGRTFHLRLRVFDMHTEQGIADASITIAIDFMEYVLGHTDASGAFSDDLFMLFSEEEHERGMLPKGRLTISAEGYREVVVYLREQDLVDDEIRVPAVMTPLGAEE